LGHQLPAASVVDVADPAYAPAANPKHVAAPPVSVKIFPQAYVNRVPAVELRTLLSVHVTTPVHGRAGAFKYTSKACDDNCALLFDALFVYVCAAYAPTVTVTENVQESVVTR
jgi:hypothetical protein